ncbi:MAG: HlyD family efflux transporter periplasmic adaptor subunit, partial [Bacteroidales bacterium]|nr:HlyD family efflux transporter periplasmic adaptor subunit [Bacteroidales bacterium]
MRYFAFILAIAFLAVSCHNEQGHDLLGCGHDHSKDDDHNHAQTSTGPNTQHKDEGHKHDNEHEHEHKLYGVTHIQYTPFGEVIKSGGEIMPARGDEQVIVANHDGLISFAYNGMQEGVAVKASQQLIALTSGGLVHDNLEVGYLEAKAQFEKAKTDYERAEKLMADTIIAKSEYLDAKLAFEKSQLAFNNIRRNYTLGGQKVLSPVAGFVKAIHVTEGEFVQAGQPLITISQNKRLVIKADVPQDAIPKLNSIRTANFITPYDGKIYATTDLNGKLISWGKST